jgi:selenocysteine lyase/cysteine desulfurase
MDPEALRAEFPIVRRWVYLNHAAFSPVPLRARRAISEHFEHGEHTAFDNFVGWYERADRVRALAARLLRTRATRIAFGCATSDGVNLVANGLDWRSGDNVVTITGEFPSNVYPWMNLACRGVELRFVSTDASGRFGVSEVERCVDSRTRVLSLSAVSFATGFRAPLEELGLFCRARGALFVVDGIQAAGALDLDVERAGVDVMAAHAYKWLMGPTGISLLYVSEGALATVRPTQLGWRSIIEWKDVNRMLDYRLELPDEARRFEPGMLNFPGLVMLEEALELILEVGIETIETRVLELTDRLAAGLARRAYRIVSSRRGRDRSGIVTFEIPGRESAATVARFHDRRIVVSEREGRIRVSPHAYNTSAEIDALLEALP